MFQVLSHKLQTKNGFSLLETVIAIGILSLMMTGVFSLVTLSIRSVSLPSNQVTAVFLAIEAVEYIRNVRDSNILAGISWGSGLSTCLGIGGCVIDVFEAFPFIDPFLNQKIRFDPNSNQYSYTGANETIFTRKIIIVSTANREAKVEVTVSWQERGRDRGFTLEEHLFNRGS